MTIINTSSHKVLLKTGGTATDMAQVAHFFIRDFFAAELVSSGILPVVIQNADPGVSKNVIWFDPNGTTTTDAETLEGAFKLSTDGTSWITNPNAIQWRDWLKSWIVGASSNSSSWETCFKVGMTGSPFGYPNVQQNVATVDHPFTTNSFGVNGATGFAGSTGASHMNNTAFWGDTVPISQLLNAEYRVVNYCDISMLNDYQMRTRARYPWAIGADFQPYNSSGGGGVKFYFTRCMTVQTDPNTNASSNSHVSNQGDSGIGGTIGTDVNMPFTNQLQITEVITVFCDMQARFGKTAMNAGSNTYRVVELQRKTV